MNEVVKTEPTDMVAANGGGGLVPKGNASTIVAQSREMAEAIASIQMAKMFPRNEIEARDKILNACTRQSLAQNACYTYTKGGSEVTGPSIRLAEMLAQIWGNIQFGIRELEQRKGESTCEAYAWNMETNVRQVKVFQVPHLRHTKKGDYPLTDPREIYELVANMGARRLRACILGVIPGDIVEEAVNQCDLTMVTKFEVTPERIKDMVEKFKTEFGVTQEQLAARIGRHLDTMSPAQMANLGKIYNSLKDGMSSVEQWFSPVAGTEKPTGKNALKEALKVKPKEEESVPDDLPL